MRLGSKKIISAKEKTKRKAVWWLFVIIIIFCVVATFIYSFLVLRPTLLSMATSRAKELAMLTQKQRLRHHIPL